MQGAELGTYRVHASSRVLRVADASLLVDVDEEAKLMGPSEGAALAHASTPGPGAGSKGPVAWRAADKILQALDAELGGFASPPAAVPASCAQTVSVKLVDVDRHEGGAPLRAAIVEQLASRCVQLVDAAAKLQLALSIVPREPANAALQMKDGKMKPLEWVVTGELTRDGKDVVTQTATANVISLHPDTAGIVNDARKIERFHALADALATAAR